MQTATLDGVGEKVVGLELDQAASVLERLFNAISASQAYLRSQELNSSHFRRWEVAGAAQLGYHEVQGVAPLQSRDLPPAATLACDLPPMSRIPAYYVANAAYDALVEWAKHDKEPPVGDDIEVLSTGAQVSVLSRDLFGNALGGIRLSQLAVPTATNTGLNSPVSSTSLCRVVGSYEPFDAATLAALYPDRQTYLGMVIAATHEAQRAGFILGPDAAATIAEATQSGIGRR